MVAGTRRQRAAPDIWPGFVDAIVALLIIMIFVLIVFALAQFFLSADLSSRNDALQRLNREVAELAEMLSIERSANADLRDNLSQVSAQLATSIADRDRLSNQLGELLPQRDALSAMLAERTAEAESFSTLLSERTVERDKLIEELTKRTAERDALTVQLAEVKEAAEAATAQTAKVSGELEDAYKSIDAEKEKVEIQLRRIASIEQDILTLRQVRENLESQIASLAQTLKASERNLAESQTELAARAKALAEREAALAARDQTIAERDKTLAERNKALAERNKLLEERNRVLAERDKTLAERNQALGALRDRSKALTTELADARERTLLAQKEIDEKDVRLKDVLGKASASEAALSEEKKVSAEAQKQVQALNLQLVALRRQLARLAAALNASEAEAKSKDVQIASLGKRLNAALASKVQELARYRSEFFGRLREVLGNHKDIRVVGDRFVFQSEVLFPSGSSDLQPLGRGQIEKLARTLREISRRIPKEINWVLRVDGHTDRIPIYTEEFPSNWELSTARAISVVKQLVDAGVPANRLAATGFGEFQPLDSRNDEVAHRRNRRIEFKLTER